MFPGVDGFHWSFGHILFVTLFFTVLTTVGVAVIAASLRTMRRVKAGQVDRIRWHAEFEELPSSDRRCRHEMTGEVAVRECPNEFDCRRCPDHSRYKRFAAAPVADSYFGLRFPAARYYHRGHTWVEQQEDGSCVIGLDEIGRRLIGRPDEVELPAPGTKLTVGGKAWTLRRSGVEVRVLSPLDGEVAECGGPDDPFYVKLKPQPDPPDFRHLLHGAEVGAWVRRELDRVMLLVHPAGAAPALADGGELIHDVVAATPEAKWDDILGAVFLEP